ncbi:TetR/AcrR family transcriptional regulator [Gordonia sp. NPDC003424]
MSKNAAGSGHDAPDRRTRFARATLEIISTRGLHAVTHRSVDEAAGLPAGSVNYYAPTRSKLLSLAIEAAHAVMWDVAMRSFAPMLAGDDATPELVLDCTTDFVMAMCTEGEGFVKAHFAILVEAQFDDDLREQVLRNRAVFIDFTEPFVSRYEPNRPERTAELIVALLEGLIQQQTLVATEMFPRFIIKGTIARIFGFPGGELEPAPA